MIGIKRLRKLGEPYETGFVRVHVDMINNIADQIERELREERDRWDEELCEAQMDKSRVMAVCLEMDKHVSGAEGAEDSPVARWARELRKALGGGERDHAEDVSMSAYDLLPEEDREAIAWVREHGGMDVVKEEWNHSRNLKRSLETAQAKVERQQRHIEFVQRKCRERQEHICELNKLKRAYVDALNGVCKRLGLTDGAGLPDMTEIIWTELDRRLMPEGMEWLVEAWLRFEGGTPVAFLDEVQKNGENFGISTVTLYSGGDFAINFRAYPNGSRVRRPAPKVLDADGVEIRVGDTVWEIEYGCEYVVTKVADGTVFVAFEDESADRYDPALLTHRAPVLAADGKSLRVGETVYEAGGTGHAYEVVSIRIGDGNPLTPTVVTCDEGDGTSERFLLSQLTHERPDSWERLEEDATLSPHSYICACGTYDNAMPKSVQMSIDLVRRAKALAERGR